ncbi:MAG: glycosyltransferase [Nitrospirae bacterium]|nr:glycosyltransferase [Nitrospirota bacterium]
MWQFDENVFRNNLDAFGQGALREVLVRPDRSRERWEIVASKEGSPTLLWDGASLHSRYDPVAEGGRWAEEIVGKLPEDARGILVLGLGLGYHVEALLARTTLPVVVFEPSPDILRASFRLLPWYRRSGQLRFFTDPGNLRGQVEGLFLASHAPSQKVRPDAYRSVKNLAGALAGASDYSLRVLVVSPVSGGSYPIAHGVVRALSGMGHRVSLFDAGDFADSLRAIGSQSRIDMHRAQLRGLFQNFMAEMILARVYQEKPDLIVGLAQSPLSTELLERLRGMNIPVAYWFVEDFRIATYWERVAPLVTSFAVIQKGEWLPRLEARGLTNVLYLPTAADRTIFRPEPTEGEDPVRFSAPLAFMGAGYYNRQHFLRHLADLGLGIWGADWESTDPLGPYLRSPGRRIDPGEAAQIYRNSMVNLNLHSSVYHRGVNPDGDFVNPRTFEIAACGGFQLVDRRSHLPELLVPEEEVAVFEDEESCRKLVRHYQSNPAERAAIAQAGLRRTLRDHTLERRMEMWLDHLYAQGFRPKGAEFPGRQSVPELVAEAEGDPELSAFFDRFRCFGSVDLDDLERGIRPQESPLSETEAAVLLLREFAREVEA